MSNKKTNAKVFDSISYHDAISEIYHSNIETQKLSYDMETCLSRGYPETFYDHAESSPRSIGRSIIGYFSEEKSLFLLGKSCFR